MEKNDDEAKALEGVIRPLIDAIAPKTIKDPKTLLAQLLRKLLIEHLGEATYAAIIDRFIIHGAETDPEKTTAELIKLREGIGDMLFGMGVISGEE